MRKHLCTLAKGTQLHMAGKREQAFKHKRTCRLSTLMEQTGPAGMSGCLSPDVFYVWLKFISTTVF